MTYQSKILAGLLLQETPVCCDHRRRIHASTQRYRLGEPGIEIDVNHGHRDRPQTEELLTHMLLVILCAILSAASTFMRSSTFRGGEESSPGRYTYSSFRRKWISSTQSKAERVYMARVTARSTLLARERRPRVLDGLMRSQTSLDCMLSTDTII